MYAGYYMFEWCVRSTRNSNDGKGFFWFSGWLIIGLMWKPSRVCFECGVRVDSGRKHQLVKYANNTVSVKNREARAAKYVTSKSAYTSSGPSALIFICT